MVNKTDIMNFIRGIGYDEVDNVFIPEQCLIDEHDRVGVLVSVDPKLDDTDLIVLNERLSSNFKNAMFVFMNKYRVFDLGRQLCNN